MHIIHYLGSRGIDNIYIITLLALTCSDDMSRTPAPALFLDSVAEESLIAYTTTQSQ